MMRRSAAALLVLLAASCVHARRTPLDEYVAAPDPTFAWNVVRTLDGPNCTGYVVDLTSQTWRHDGEVDRNQWHHWLIVVKPAEVAHRTGLLMIDGGHNGGDPPDRLEPMLALLATSTNSVVALLRQVPNEPLVFPGDGRERSEDAILAYTWRRCIETGDMTWPAQLPMVKSAVRAMDTVQALMADPANGALPIDDFVVTGGSKRGWTTWLTAAVDRRVRAIVPVVIDLLNIPESMRHHHAAYGFWAPALHDYEEAGITEHLGRPEAEPVMRTVDPFVYRDRLTMPKYIVNASGDQFFCPDSSQFYWDSLQGERHLRYVPNSQHGIEPSEAMPMVAFYEMILNGTPRPRYSWRFEPDGSIRFETRDPAQQILLWQATNPEARDFRMDTIGRTYASAPLTDEGGGVYVGRVDPPERGWKAYFVEATYDVGGRFPFKVTSGVRVTPDTLPHAVADGR